MSAFDQTPLRPDAPAMPELHINPWDKPYTTGGLTARQHAAIALCVPDSGTQWLDDMIRARLRDEFAAKAMQAALGFTRGEYGRSYPDNNFNLSLAAYATADAMLAARQKGASHD